MSIKGVIFDFKRTLYNPDSNAVVAGALELLGELRARGYVLALLCKKSATDRVELVHFLGLDPFFCIVLMIDGNKNAGHIQECISAMGLDKTEVAVVGDRVEEEICAGNSAGVTTIWFKQGKFALVEPKTAEQIPTHVIYGLREVLGLV